MIVIGSCGTQHIMFSQICIYGIVILLYICVVRMILIFTSVQFQFSSFALDADNDFCNQRDQPAQ